MNPQHRNLQPTGGAGAGVGVPPPVVAGTSMTRINDAFDGIRQEFDILASDLGVVRAQRDEYEAKCASSSLFLLSKSRSVLADQRIEHLQTATL